MANEVQLRISKDLPQEKPVIKFKSKYQKWKYEANYRKATDKKCCKTCNHCLTFTNTVRYFHKCNLQGLSHSAATDITLNSVCDYYKEGKHYG